MRFHNFWRYRNILLSKEFAKALKHARQNVIADHSNQPLKAGPYMAELDITYRCNCKCQMCQRWRDNRPNELSLTEYRNLAASLHQLGVHQVSIAGGEPLLREDVFDIIQTLAGYGMSVNLCTNGILVNQFLDEICLSGATCVTVSLDGNSSQSHNELRGTADSFDLIQDGIIQLARRPFKKRPVLRVRMTVSNRNVTEIRSFYRHWQNIVDDVLLQPVHHCEDAFYSGLNADALAIDSQKLATQIKDTPLAHNGYLSTLVHSLANEGTFPKQPCYAGVLMARINPWGQVYPCLEQHVCVGSIRKNDFASIWRSEEFYRERRRLAKNRACVCWYNNTALIGHYGRVLQKTNLDTMGRGLRSWANRLQHALFPAKQ